MLPASAASAAFNVTLGPAAKLAINGGFTGGASPLLLAPQPIVTVQDAGGNTVTTSSASIVLDPSPSGAIACTTPASGTTQLAVNGVVSTYAGCTLTAAAGSYTIIAASSGLTSAVSGAIVIP